MEVSIIKNKITLPYNIEIYYMIIAGLSGETEMLIRTEGCSMMI